MNKIIDLMKICETKGYSATASAAVVGNWIAEGALNEKNVTLDRFTNGYHEVGALGFTAGVAESYLVWCRNNNKAWDDFVNQAEYALEKTVPAYYPMFHEFGIWRYFQEIRMYLNCYTTLDAFKKAVPDLIETATISFMCLWWSPTYKQIKGGLTWASRDSGKYELTFDQRLQQEIRDRTKYAVQAYNEFMKEVIMTQSPKQNYPPQNAIPYASGTIGSDGCGVAMIMALIGWTSLEKWQYVADWMKKHSEPDIGPYACASGGTWAQGIPAFLNAHGVPSNKLTGVHSEAGLTGTTAKKAFRNHIKKGGRGWWCAGGVRTGCPSDYWTYGGHYLGIIKYDSANDLYYVTDSASTAREGWHKWSEIEAWIKHCGCVDVKKEVKEDMTVIKEVKLGDHGTHVYLAQTLLRGRGFKGKDGKALALDFDAGVNTMFAKDAFCKARKIDAKDFWKDITGGLCR